MVSVRCGCRSGLRIRPVRSIPKLAPHETLVPLQAVTVHATINDLSTQVTLEQHYQNKSAHTIDTEYVFPLDENSCVTAFEAVIEGNRIVGVIKEKEEARQVFEKAKQQGKQASLLESTSSPNIFNAEVGNLHAGQSCVIRITYVTTLDLQGSSIRFVIPSHVTPRYTPSCPHSALNDDVNQMDKELAETLIKSYVSSPSARLPYKFRCEATIVMPAPILSVTSSSHGDIVKTDIVAPSDRDLQQQLYKANLWLMRNEGEVGEIPLERDFVVLIEHAAIHSPRILAEYDPATSSTAALLTFCPPGIEDQSEVPAELLFLIDQSGSMSGGRINQVRATMNILLRSLPTACRFNIIGFGSNFEKLWPTSKQYDAASLAQASKHCEHLEANLGGTELFPPLQSILASEPIKGCPRQLFLLTDGEVSNVQELIELVQRYKATIRVFTFGIGSGVDRHLVKALARAGNGFCEFIDGSTNQGMQGVVMRQLGRALQPAITHVEVDWSQFVEQPSKAGEDEEPGDDAGSKKMKDAIAKIVQCPSKLPPIFSNSRYFIYALNVSIPASFAVEGVPISHIRPITTEGNASSSSSSSAPGGAPIASSSSSPSSSSGPVATVSGFGGSEGAGVSYKLPLSQTQVVLGTMIHKLAARAKIRELEETISSSSTDRQSMDAQILSLSLKNAISSRLTSWVAISDQEPTHPRSMYSEWEDDVRLSQTQNHQSPVFGSSLLGVGNAPAGVRAGGGGGGGRGGGRGRGQAPQAAADLAFNLARLPSSSTSSSSSPSQPKLSKSFSPHSSRRSSSSSSSSSSKSSLSSLSSWFGRSSSNEKKKKKCKESATPSVRAKCDVADHSEEAEEERDEDEDEDNMEMEKKGAAPQEDDDNADDFLALCDNPAPPPRPSPCAVPAAAAVPPPAPAAKSVSSSSSSSSFSLFASSSSASSSSSSSSSPSSSSASFYNNLISCQQFDGSWQNEARVVGILSGVSKKKVDVDALSSTLGVSTTVLVTVWALFVLSSVFAAQQNEWSMLASKAKKFVTKNVTSGKTVEQLQKELGLVI